MTPVEFRQGVIFAWFLHLRLASYAAIVLWLFYVWFGVLTTFFARSLWCSHTYNSFILGAYEESEKKGGTRIHHDSSKLSFLLHFLFEMDWGHVNSSFVAIEFLSLSTCTATTVYLVGF